MDKTCGHQYEWANTNVRRFFRNMKANKTAHFDLVDILRAFAALTVVVYHTIIICGWQDFPTTYPLAWFRYGWMGVDIFFS